MTAKHTCKEVDRSAVLIQGAAAALSPSSVFAYVGVADTEGVQRGSGCVCSRESTLPPPQRPYHVACFYVGMGVFQERLPGRFAVHKKAQQTHAGAHERGRDWTGEKDGGGSWTSYRDPLELTPRDHESRLSPNIVTSRSSNINKKCDDDDDTTKITSKAARSSPAAPHNS